MKIQIPKATEVHIIVDEKNESIVIDIDNGAYSVRIDNIDFFKIHYVPEK